MSGEKQLLMTSVPAISAIYYALLTGRYDYYSMGRSKEHNDRLRSFSEGKEGIAFFSAARQNTCEVYPYWPRAAILETAAFYLRADCAGFVNYEALHADIMQAENISDEERTSALWEWLAQFPREVSRVLCSDGFRCYMEWENNWIAEQNAVHAEKLCQIQKCLNVCAERYRSAFRAFQIVINPIKCIYSADYHLLGEKFIFSSGTLQIESALHEFLHHVVHPVVKSNGEKVLSRAKAWRDIDDSYYLSGDEAGRMNAFEECMVRSLTQTMLDGYYPEKLDEYLDQVLAEENV